MKDLKLKIALGIAIALLLAAAVFIIKGQFDAAANRARMQQDVIEMKQLQDGVVRAQSKYVTKDDFEKFADGMEIDLDNIQDDLDNFDADMKLLSKSVASSKGYRASGLPSSGVRPRPVDPNNPVPTCPDGTTCDQFGYLTNSQMLALHEPFSDKLRVPIGDVTFDAWKEKPWSVNVLPRQYKLHTVLGQDEDGRHYVYNRFQIQVDGKTHNVPIEQSEVVERLPEAEFRFDPHLSLGVAIGPSISTGNTDPDEPSVRAEVMPALDVSLFSYGETRVYPDWKFIGIGVGYEAQNQNMGIILNPADYNVGKHLPLMNNLYLGPTVGVDLGGSVFVGGGIRVGL
jgi:hypothetical protein